MWIYSKSGFGDAKTIFAGLGGLVASHVFCRVLREVDY